MAKKKYIYSIGELTRRLIKLSAPQAGNIILSTVASIIGNVAQMGLMGFGAMMILSLTGKTTMGSNALWIALTAVCALLIPIMRYLEGEYSHVGAYMLLAEMRTRLFSDLRRLAPACLVDRQKGDIISIAIADIETIENFFAHTVGPTFTVILLPLIALITAANVHWLYAVCLIPLYLIISIIIPLLAMSSGRRIGMEYRVQVAELKSLVLESVYGLKDVQIFGQGGKRMDMVREKSKVVNSITHRKTIHKQLVTAMPTFFIYLSRIMIIAISSYLAITNQDMLNGVIVLSLVVSASFSSTQSLVSVVSNLLETYAAAERLFEIEDSIPEVIEADKPRGLERIDEIDFDGVVFAYKSRNKIVLDGVDLSIKPGDKIGIIGESGAGKSTILRLLMRFWETGEGAIKLNDTNIRDYSLRDLRDRIALLEQHTFIYNDTVAANIALGKPDASMDEIREAARRAGIDRLIETLPDGYDTVLGELGNGLSGGEKQRIGIARIMLTDPDVIVMDEPTSSLDIFNEKGILKTLDDEYKDKTIIIVSHRKSTLTGCRKIYRLNGEKKLVAI